jgi:hypothetical protein
VAWVAKRHVTFQLDLMNLFSPFCSQELSVSFVLVNEKSTSFSMKRKVQKSLQQEKF